jgi:hypothetical protein
MYTSEMMGRPTLASTVEMRSLAVGPRTGSDRVAGGRSTQSPDGTSMSGIVAAVP